MHVLRHVRSGPFLPHGVGQCPPVGISGGFGTAQAVIGEGYRIPVGVSLLGQKAIACPIVVNCQLGEKASGCFDYNYRKLQRCSNVPHADSQPTIDNTYLLVWKLETSPYYAHSKSIKSVLHLQVTRPFSCDSCWEEYCIACYSFFLLIGF